MKIKGNLELAKKELLTNKNNAVAYVFKDAKLNNSKGLLVNCVFTIKDNFADKNVKARASSLFLDTFQPSYKATCLELLEAAGATCVGRTNLDEFGLGGSGEHSAYGKIFHPKNNEYLVGGSSSGAAATFTNAISFAIGSDTGDSVRKPASIIGVVGFKPSYGAISRYGMFAFASSLDTVSYFTHNVSDLILLSSVLYKQDRKHDLTSENLEFNYNDIKLVKPKTVAYLDCFNELEPSVKEAYQNIINKLQKENVKLVKVSEDKILLKSIDTIYRIIAFSEASSNLSNLTNITFGQKLNDSWVKNAFESRSKKIGKMAQARLILGSYFLEKDNQIKYFVQAKKIRNYLKEYFTNIHTQADIFIYPASYGSAPKIGEKKKSTYMDYILTYANLVGNPSMTIKLGKNKNNGLPFNLTIDAKIYNDTKLFSHALYIEELIGDQNE